MAKPRILFISQQITPYLPASDISNFGRDLPRAFQEKKYEVRTFMPNYGAVNERRNQLHEVIRLSGINIIIKDTDHPLIIKVASMQPSRIQVYFIDNDDYFQKSADDVDEIGSNREDNDERIIFYTRGTMETAKKLRWNPDYIIASGWISTLIPLYLKSLFGNGPDFHKTKIVYVPLNQKETAPLHSDFLKKLADDGIKEEDLKILNGIAADKNMLHKIALEYADAVVFNSPEPDAELLEIVQRRNIPYRIIDREADLGTQFDDFLKSELQ